MQYRWGAQVAVFTLLGGLVWPFDGLSETNTTFTVGTYNLKNYLILPKERRSVKPPAARRLVRRSLLSLKLDVVALQEVGSTNALHHLRKGLKREGLHYPHWEQITAYDTNIHVSILSRYPFTRRRAHTNDFFLLTGRRYQVARGFAEVTVGVGKAYRFTLICGHLKSRRPVYYGDQAELRREEARILRQKIDAHLVRDPDHNLVVLGDFNDHIHSDPIRLIQGRGKRRLTDTQPAERFGADPDSENREGRSLPAGSPIRWTHFFDDEETYSRVDFIFISPGMAEEWMPARTYIPRLPYWAGASDHRPLVATFRVDER